MPIEPLRFDSVTAVYDWLTETGNNGLPHSTRPGEWVALQFFDGGVGAFTGPESLVVLEDW